MEYLRLYRQLSAIETGNFSQYVRARRDFSRDRPVVVRLPLNLKIAVTSCEISPEYRPLKIYNALQKYDQNVPFFPQFYNLKLLENLKGILKILKIIKTIETCRMVCKILIIFLKLPKVKKSKPKGFFIELEILSFS